MLGKARARYSVAERVEQCGPAVEKRLAPVFESAGVSYPPADLAFLAFKDSRTLEVCARSPGQRGNGGRSGLSNRRRTFRLR